VVGGGRQREARARVSGAGAWIRWFGWGGVCAASSLRAEVGVGEHRGGGRGRTGGGKGAHHGSGGMDPLVWMGNGDDQRGGRWCGWGMEAVVQTTNGGGDTEVMKPYWREKRGIGGVEWRRLGSGQNGGRVDAHEPSDDMDGTD
jgi:hypothetical protein